MGEPGEERALAPETLHRERLDQCQVHQLDGYPTLEATVSAVGEPDRAHPAVTEGAFQGVGTDFQAVEFVVRHQARDMKGQKVQASGVGPSHGTVRTLLPALMLAVVAPAAPRQLRPGERFDVIRYELTLTPDLAGKAVSGFETIVLRSTAQGLSAVAFSQNALTIDAATVGGQPIP